MTRLPLYLVPRPPSSRLVLCKPILGKDEAESSILSGGSSQEPDFSGFFAPPIVSTRKRVARIMRAIAQGIFVLGLWLGFAASIYVLF